MELVERMNQKRMLLKTFSLKNLFPTFSVFILFVYRIFFYLIIQINKFSIKDFSFYR